jgi:hypothetical protein
MALLAMLACAAQAPGLRRLAPMALPGLALSLVSWISLVVVVVSLNQIRFVRIDRPVTQSEILHGFGELTEDRKSEPIASSL